MDNQGLCLLTKKHVREDYLINWKINQLKEEESWAGRKLTDVKRTAGTSLASKKGQDG